MVMAEFTGDVVWDQMLSFQVDAGQLHADSVWAATRGGFDEDDYWTLGLEAAYGTAEPWAGLRWSHTPTVVAEWRTYLQDWQNARADRFLAGTDRAVA
jgi:hypothetical protein